MSAPQFFVDELGASDGRVALSVDDSRHALRSLRLRPGEMVTLADGRGMVGLGRVGAAQPGGVALIEVDEVSRVVQPAPVVSVALAPPKGERLTWAVQKLAELGVDELVLFESERSVRTWPAGRSEKALGRVRAVAREAAMQARRPFLMEVSGPVSFQEALAAGSSTAVVLWEAGGKPLQEVLVIGAGIRLLVGPEGGFGERDLAVLKGAGALVATLGPGILRTETAVVAAAALALARAGRLG